MSRCRSTTNSFARLATTRKRASQEGARIDSRRHGRKDLCVRQRREMPEPARRVRARRYYDDRLAVRLVRENSGRTPDQDTARDRAARSNLAGVTPALSGKTGSVVAFEAGR